MKTIKRSLSILLVLAVALLVQGCESKSTTIHMATKPMTEQLIIGHLMKMLIEQDTDLKVKITEGVGGGVANIQPAMVNREFDFYPEYTGTGWNTVLKEGSLYHETMFDDLLAGYGEMDMTWTGMLGFNNTYGLIVTREAAEQYNLRTYSDLAAVSQNLTLGAEYDFYEREDGFSALQETYGMEFKDTMDMDIGLKYDAILQKKIDVMTIFTTDGRLSVSDVVVLEDDKELYPSYMCGFVVRKEVLGTHPELQTVFDKVTGLITDAEMAEWNFMVESEGKSPEEVASYIFEVKNLGK